MVQNYKAWGARLDFYYKRNPRPLQILHNNSNKYTYDQIQVAATYLDDQGKIVDKDKLVIRQKLPPGDEKLIGSVDFKSRGAATRGSLTVTGAATVN